jgi:calcineurin-like phosphoesterase family protein
VLAQVLNRDFLMDTVRGTEDGVRRVIANREAGVLGEPDDPQDIDTADLHAIADALADALERESASDGPPTPHQVGDAPPPPKDDYAYMPRESVMAMMQAAVEGHARDQLAVETQEMSDDERGGLLPVVTDERIEGVPLTLTDDGRRIWSRMQIAHPMILSDPGWIQVVGSMITRWRHGRAPFVERPGAPPALAESARIVIVGDWGSGLPRAARVADRIREQLTDPAAEPRQKHVIHLGDVYYGGEQDEYHENFLKPWPVAPGTRDVASYTLNGNHDMYTGGKAYFATGLSDARFAGQGGSSTFVLANEHWQFLALDTSYEDAGLHGDQADWVRQMRTDNPGRKTVLLSHHQLFSAYEAGAHTLRQKISPVLEEQPIDAWFWGHEHRCMAYRDLERVRFASCIGHGGIPEYLAEQALSPPKGLVYEYRKQHGTGWQPWNTFGFVVLDVDGPRIEVQYIDEDGERHWSTELP